MSFMRAVRRQGRSGHGSPSTAPASRSWPAQRTSEAEWAPILDVNLRDPISMCAEIFATLEIPAASTIEAVERNRALLVHTPATRFGYFIKRLSPRP